jgi:hypothetical protein
LELVEPPPQSEDDADGTLWDSMIAGDFDAAFGDFDQWLSENEQKPLSGSAIVVSKTVKN